MTIRSALPHDAWQIATIHVEAWRAAYRGIVPDEYLDALSVEQRHSVWQRHLEARESLIWVAEDGDSVRGWISAGRSRDTDATQSTGEIWAVYVDPHQWSNGIGRELCSTAEQELRAQDCTDVTLWVLKDNERALRFYLRSGFVSDPGAHRIIERSGKSLSEVRMRKQLV